MPDIREQQEVALPQLSGVIVMPGTGEQFDLADEEDALRAGHMLQEMASQIRGLKSRVDAVTRFHMKANAAVRFTAGRYSSFQDTGRATYNAQAIYDAAIEAEIPQDAVEKMVPLERVVKDGRELNSLAKRDNAWAAALAAGTDRKAGSVKYEIAKGGTPAPAIPEHVQQQVASQQEAERAAADIGI